jgi:hypothetical protein
MQQYAATKQDLKGEITGLSSALESAEKERALAIFERDHASVDILRIPINKVGELLDGPIHTLSVRLCRLPDTADFGLATRLAGMRTVFHRVWVGAGDVEFCTSLALQGSQHYRH